MRTEEFILDDSQKVQLDMLAKQYADICDEYNAIDAKKKAINAVIKNMLDSFGISKYTSSDNISLSMTKKKNISFDEDKLLAYCHDLNDNGKALEGLIKTQEYVDMEVLERMIYADGTLKESLKLTQVVKPDTVTLRCNRKETLNE